MQNSEKIHHAQPGTRNSFSAMIESLEALLKTLLYKLSTLATRCSMPVWHIRGRDQMLRRILLKVVSNELNSGEEENQRAEPYRERQKLLRSLVLTKELQEEKE